MGIWIQKGFPVSHDNRVIDAQAIEVLLKRPRGYITFFMLNSTELKLKYGQTKKCFALSLSGVVFIMLINLKMPTNIGILTFLRR